MIKYTFFLLLVLLVFFEPVNGKMKNDEKQIMKKLSQMDIGFEPVIIHFSGKIPIDTVVLQNGLVPDSYQNSWFCDKSWNSGNGYGDLNLECTLKKGMAKSTGIALNFQINNWSVDNYVFIPSAAYNGNRFRVLDIPYPPEYKNEADRIPDLPVTITNVPHLNNNEGPSKMELTTGDASTPCVGVYFSDKKKGILIFTHQGTALGNSGITVEESNDRTHANITISTPAVRTYRAAGTQLKASDDQAHDWNTGESVRLECRVYAFDASDIPAFYHEFFKHRKSFYESATCKNIIPFSQAMQMQEELQNGLRWYEKGRYYKNGNGDSPYGHIQLGWVGGLMQTYPLFIAGDEESKQRSVSTINTILQDMPGQSGFLFGTCKNGILYDDNFNKGNKPQVAMIRKNADGLYFLLKQIMLLEGRGETVNPEWKNHAQKWADAFVKLWNTYHQLGQLIDPDTGEIIVGGSTAGALAPAALVLAAQYYKNPKYINVAKEAATLYYERDVKNGYTTGGPGEILQCPDSESAFALLESFTVLYEATSDKIWLKRAETMAALYSSWVVSYDYKFPEESILGRLNVHSTGSVWANVQNKHSAPGICTASGDCLLKLYRATGDEKYLELLQDIAHNMLQYMSTEKRPVGSNKNGYINERVNMSDWEGKGAVGNVNDSSVSWCETAVMLTCVEIPGIYIIPDKGKVFCFDHVTVRETGKNSKGLEIEIINDTVYPASVNLFAEPSDYLSSALGFNIYDRYQRVDLTSGEKKVLLVSPNGNISVVGY